MPKGARRIASQKASCQCRRDSLLTGVEIQADQTAALQTPQQLIIDADSKLQVDVAEVAACERGRQECRQRLGGLLIIRKVDGVPQGRVFSRVRPLEER